jgi:hypothetical protein
VLLDKNTKNNLSGIRKGYEQYASEIRVIDVPETFSQKQASRWIKTSIHNYVSAPFFCIDCDTIITAALNVDFNPTVKIGAVLDTHCTLKNHHLKKYFEDSDKRLEFCASFKDKKHYNGGLIYCDGSPESRLFFNKWHELWLYSSSKDNSQDMPSLNQANYELNGIITELPGEWNCQISHNGLPYLFNAKIIHYYATSLISFENPFIPASDRILRSIKETGLISDDIIKFLNNPKTAFERYSRIISDRNTLDILDSSYFSKLLWLKKYHPNLFFRVNTIISKIKRV